MTEYIEGSSFNKAIEIYNGTGAAVDLAAGGYTLELYSNGSPTVSQSMSLSGTVANGDVYVLANSGADAAILAQADVTNNAVINFNGDDAIVLRKNGAVVDAFGQVGFDPGSEWGSGLTSTADNTLRRKADVCAGDTNETDVFDPSVEWDGFANNTFDGLGSHTANCGGGPVTTNPTGTGAADPDMLKAGESTLLTVAVTPGENPTSTGLAVSCDLSAIGVQLLKPSLMMAAMVTSLLDDNTFSYQATVDASTTAGDKTLDCTISDGEARNGSASISLNVYEILPIGTVNGVVGDTDDGTAHRSPYAPPSGNGSGQTVVVQGVIYEKTLQATSFGTPYQGFFIQNTAATADGDPNTSDGLFVFTSTYNDLIDGYMPTVGDEVVISGRISEYYNMTELSSATLVKPVVHSGLDIEAEVSPVVADPPSDLANANRYWERLQSMRIQVPTDSIVLGGRNVFSPADAEIWVASPDSTIAQRVDPYTRRAFRDAHPLDDNYDPNNWDGNGYRVLMGSLGIKATEGDAQALIDPARTFDTVTNAPAGGLNYTYSKYRIEISEQPTFSEGVDPAQNNPPTTFDRTQDYSIVDYNLENLYDYRDNPFSGCDFNGTGNDKCSKTGTPFLSDITPSYDYVPDSDAVIKLV